jgi:hypothetical protein
MPLLSVAEPRVAPPSWNVTVPVGVPEPGGEVTIAVSVSCCPETTELDEAISDVNVEVIGVVVRSCRSSKESRLGIRRRRGETDRERLSRASEVFALEDNSH